MKPSDKNRNKHFCILETGKENNSDVLESKEHTISVTKKGQQENGSLSLAFSPHPNAVQEVVRINESGASTAGTITLQCSDHVDTLHSKSGLLAEVKYDSYNIKVQVKKELLSHSATNYEVGKWKCYKNRRYHKGHCCKWHKRPSPPTDFLGKYETPFKYTIQIDSNQNPSIKVSVVGKETKVKYINRKQKLMVSVEHGDESKKCNQISSPKYVNTLASDTGCSATEANCHSDTERDFSFQEKEDSVTSYTYPDWHVLIPPPAEFANSEDSSFDNVTEVLSLPIASDTNVSDTFSAALSYGEGKDFQREVCANEKDFPEDIVFSEFCYAGEPPPEGCNFTETYFDQKCSEINDILQIRNNSLIDTRSIMLVSCMESKNIRRNSFPTTYIDILSPVHPRRDSGFYSMPSLSLKVLPKSAKATNVYSRNVHAPNSCTELSTSFTSLFSNLGCLQSSCCYAFTSYDHNMTAYHAELERNLGSAFFTDHYVEYMEECREMDQMAVEDFHSNVNSNEEQKEKLRSPELSRSLHACEEDSEFTEGGTGGEALNNDRHKDKKCIELENEEPFSHGPSLSRNPLSDDTNNTISYADETKECLQEKYLVMHPNTDLKLCTTESEVVRKKRVGSVITVITGELEQKLIIQGDSKTITDSFDIPLKKEPMLPCAIREKTFLSSLLDADEPGIGTELQSFTEVQEISENIHEDLSCQEDSAQAAAISSASEDEEILADTFFTEAHSPLSGEWDIKTPSHDFGAHPAAHPAQELHKPSSEKSEEQNEVTTDLSQNPDTVISPQNQSNTEEKSVVLPNEKGTKDSNASTSSQQEAADRWARRRKQFKDSKRCNSTGENSIASMITEGSINSEDGRSVDLSLGAESEDKGFYTEIFHSASWVFRGDDASPESSPKCLSKRPRPVAVRERTVRIAKGTGDYPWGFRIQFSKPILVTEVDTNSAAEEAGLQIGDIVMVVNGTDVTSMPHSEAADLARKGPDILTMLVGSDISRCPNTPRPTCRGYLHKRTQSAILKGWRKRWFVLKHDGYLYYYKNKKDEGKCRPLEVTKLEGAEIGVDTSLGKPFVFKCSPQNGNRVFFFCATSNQEMKRWLEAMEMSVHPVNQNHVWVDVTMHNTSLPPLAIKNPECLGLLHQLDKSKDVWVQHYCILKDGCLYFYASIRSTHAHGGIYLQGYTVSEQALGSRRSVIEIKPPSEEFKTFYLCAENANENKRWITALRTSVSKWLPLNQAIQDFMNRPLEETRM
ncbi:uncharacterized protein LOC125436538 isoform X2 [Sphaerodactylus townsendi]|uniref:uncharacterized protein LOC125436538 isoform X2 n=1 Tax=Sphaerodactylus townsendi TaxID=933632 RepID=UPI002027171C|nr:uncharacterized protein LOC125436538 isoform X2 [Sphaerodactylus townsendi]